MKTYKINIRRSWYGPRETVEEHLDGGQAWRGTRAAARAEITRLEGKIYFASSGETSRPDYRVALAKEE